MGQGGAFPGVGAHADFVQHHQRARSGLVDDAGEIRHVGRKSRKTFANILVVTDIRQQMLDGIDVRTGFTRYVETGSDEERRQANGLHRDSLAAGVGSREDENRKIVAEAKIVGHAFIAADERMTKAR